MWWNNQTRNRTNAEWFFMKLMLALPVAFYLIFCLHKYHAAPFPLGVCNYFDCSLLAQFPIKQIIVVLLLLWTALYVLEKFMLPVILCLFIISLFVLSLDESNANPAENGIITLLFFAQLLAYTLHYFKPKSNLSAQRIQFSLQIVAAVYVLSGLSKLSASGVEWFTADAPKYTLEALRVLYTKYTATGNEEYALRATNTATYLQSHLWMVKIILFSTILIEVGAFVMLLWQRSAPVYGLFLLAMHSGIYVVMNIVFPTIMIPMLAVTINPLYHLFRLFTAQRDR